MAMMIKGFEPIIDNNCEAFVLGTMTGADSLRKEEYYANERNQFWKIVFSLVGEETNVSYVEKQKILLKNHIALWDVIQSCEREGSSDSNIKNPVANDFKSFYAKYPKIKSIYFNGKKAEELYKKLVIKNGVNEGVSFTTLPSTSPANAIKFEEKLGGWKSILHLFKKI
jgi:hypoxanthine-DNA glycosylase